jgi:hypothetical protein
MGNIRYLLSQEGTMKLNGRVCNPNVAAGLIVISILVP